MKSSAGNNESSKQIWNEHSFKDDSPLRWRIGDLSLSAKNPGDEIWISQRYCEANDQVEQEAELSWARWALKKKSSALYLVPALPDRSVVVKPESAFRLLPGVQARIFVRVPVWVAVKPAGPQKRQLTEIPSAILSLTWFGSPVEGELCYWISSSARREVKIDAERPHLAICPVQLKNKSEEDLLIEKLCLRVKWLSLYESNGQLWSNSTSVSFQGTTEMSDVSVSSGPPLEAPKAELKSVPREAAKRSFAIKTFFSFGHEDNPTGSEAS
jgi:hypothetical protein